MINSGNKNTTNISKEGLSREEARFKAEEKINSKYLKIFSEIYGLIILFILQLQNGHIHSKIMRGVKNFLSNGYNDQASLNRHFLEDGWNEKDTDSEEENTDSEEEEDRQESDDEETS